MTVNNDNIQEDLLKESEDMCRSGVHFGYSRSSSHPKMKPYFFGVKNNVEIFNLEKITLKLKEAEIFLNNLGSKGAKILFVATKPEAKDIVEKAAKELNMPHVVERWLGGTLTNFGAIQKRLSFFKSLQAKKAAGEFPKYSKKEAGRLEKKLAKMERNFGGLQLFAEKPAAVIVVDSKKEKSAIEEARKLGIPVVAILNSDCDPAPVDYLIPGSDTVTSSIQYFLDKLTAAYKEGQKNKKEKEVV
ncbi:30S ribosomal protein S2 [Patescibacteria group bacterium]|nr:30S ribosomal protein S2 [Patescibacteria group bacterium]